MRKIDSLRAIAKILPDHHGIYLFKDKSKIVLDKCQEVADQLSNAGIRVQVDDSDLTPGNKYYKWEARGVPLRLEIGPRDVKEKHVQRVLQPRNLKPLSLQCPLYLDLMPRIVRQDPFALDSPHDDLTPKLLTEEG